MKPGSIVPSGLTANRVTQIPMDLFIIMFPWRNPIYFNMIRLNFGYTSFLDKTISPHYPKRRPTVQKAWPDFIALVDLNKSGKPAVMSQVTFNSSKTNVMRNQMMLLSATINDHKCIYTLVRSRDSCLVHLSSLFSGVDKPSASPSSSTCCSSKVLQWFDNLCIACKALDTIHISHIRRIACITHHISIDIIHCNALPNITYHIYSI